MNKQAQTQRPRSLWGSLVYLRTMLVFALFFLLAAILSLPILQEPTG